MKKAILLLLWVLVLCCGCAQLSQTNQTIPKEPSWKLPSSPYGPEDFTQDADFLTCSAGNAVVGIDVSSHQQTVDWQKVKAAGVEFVFIRLGYRGYESGKLNEDSFAKENLAGAKAAGLKVGAYFFSQAVSEEEAEAEAAFALEILGGMELDLPLVYDWEYISDTARTANVDRRTLTDCTKAFCRQVEQAGYSAMIYFNASQGRDMLLLQELEQYPWWLAKYDTDTEFLCRVDMWQYTNTGKVDGVQGNVDVNLLFTDYGLGQAVFSERIQ